MSYKKDTDTVLSSEDTSQVQRLLETYHQAATNLHQSANQTEADMALADINALSTIAQITFLKALARENTTDAADILIAINALSPAKEVRKEARRALIRLEATRTYPQWTPPVSHAPAVQLNIAHPPRFWKGFVTQSREEGEIQVMLCWEQGYDYHEVRLVALLLDYWQDGVKDAGVEVESKRHIEERISEFRHSLSHTSLVDCTLAEGKRLLEEALSINAWKGSKPGKDYSDNLPTINKLILEATDLGEDRGRTFITPEMEEQEVVVNFLGGWSMGDYSLCYDLMTHDNALRTDLSRNEWIEQHRAWANEAHPSRMELEFVHERKNVQSQIWLPSSAAATNTTRKTLEVGWSLELIDTLLSGTLQEMPLATAANKETGRHWFWTSFILVRERNAWRIQQVTDEDLKIQELSVQELQNRIQEHNTAIAECFKKRETDVQGFVEEMSWRLCQLLHYYDTLITQQPQELQRYEEAYSQAVLTGNPERIMVYLERLLQRAPDNRADILRRFGSTLVGLAYKETTQNLAERRAHLLNRAEEILREANTIETTAMGHMLLGEFFLSEERNDEAEAELLKARELQPNQEEEASIEAGLGNLAMRREQMDEAIPHYQRVIEANPAYPGIWFNLGFAHRLLGHLDEAQRQYERAIELEPADMRAYSELTAIHMNQGESDKAQTLMEQAIRIVPNSAHLHALYASVLFERGNHQTALRELEKAEKLEPDLEIVHSVRKYIDSAKKR